MITQRAAGEKKKRLPIRFPFILRAFWCWKWHQNIQKTLKIHQKCLKNTYLAPNFPCGIGLKSPEIRGYYFTSPGSQDTPPPPPLPWKTTSPWLAPKSTMYLQNTDFFGAPAARFCFRMLLNIKIIWKTVNVMRLFGVWAHPDAVPLFPPWAVYLLFHDRISELIKFTKATILLGIGTQNRTRSCSWVKS